MKINTALSTLGITNPIVYGCMGLGGGWNQNPVSAQDVQQAHAVVDTLLDQGINFIDHADIYTFGKAEVVFGKVLKERPELADQLVLQSKCGIRFEDHLGPGRYDFSKEWLESSVDGILERLGIQHLPILLLHRPDPLMSAEEVGDTLNKLKETGKVGGFGVSNMSAAQMDLIQQHLNTKLIANQMELSLSKLDWIDDGVMHNVGSDKSVSFPSGTIEYCIKQEVQLQAWGSLSQGLFTGRDNSDQSSNVQQTSAVVNELSHLYGVSKEAIVLAWLMKHPANVMPVIGTTNLDRIRACNEATSVNLSREHWYKLYVTSRGEVLP